MTPPASNDSPTIDFTVVVRQDGAFMPSPCHWSRLERHSRCTDLVSVKIALASIGAKTKYLL